MKTVKNRGKIVELRLWNLGKIGRMMKLRAFIKFLGNLDEKMKKSLKSQLKNKILIGQNTRALSLMTFLKKSILNLTLGDAFAKITYKNKLNYTGKTLKTITETGKSQTLKLQNLAKIFNILKQRAFNLLLKNLYNKKIQNLRKSIKKLKRKLKKTMSLKKRALGTNTINSIQKSALNRILGHIFFEITKNLTQNYKGNTLKTIKDCKKNNIFKLLNLAKIIDKLKHKAFIKLNLAKIIDKLKHKAFIKFVVNSDKNSLKNLDLVNKILDGQLKGKSSFSQKILGKYMINIIKSSGLNRILGEILGKITENSRLNYSSPILNDVKNKKTIIDLKLFNLSKIAFNIKQRAFMCFTISLNIKNTKKLNTSIEELKKQLKNKILYAKKSAILSLMNSLKKSSFVRIQSLVFGRITETQCENYISPMMVVVKEKKINLGLKLCNLGKIIERSKGRAFHNFATNLYDKNTRELNKELIKKKMTVQKGAILGLMRKLGIIGLNRVLGNAFMLMTECLTEKYAGNVLNIVKEKRKNRDFKIWNLGKIMKKNKMSAFYSFVCNVYQKNVKDLREDIKKNDVSSKKMTGARLVNIFEKSTFTRLFSDAFARITDHLSDNYVGVRMSIIKDKKKLRILKLWNLAKITNKLKQKSFNTFTANLNEMKSKNLQAKLSNKTVLSQKSSALSLANTLKSSILNKHLGYIFSTITNQLSENYIGPILKPIKSQKKIIFLKLCNLAKISNKTIQKSFQKLMINLYNKHTKNLKSQLKKTHNHNKKTIGLITINTFKNSVLNKRLGFIISQITENLCENYKGPVLSIIKQKKKIVNLQLCTLARIIEKNKYKVFHTFVKILNVKHAHNIKNQLKKSIFSNQNITALLLINIIKNSGLNRIIGEIFACVTNPIIENYNGNVLSLVKNRKKIHKLKLLNIFKITEKIYRKAFYKFIDNLSLKYAKRLKGNNRILRRNLKKKTLLSEKAMGLVLINTVKAFIINKRLGDILGAITDPLDKNCLGPVMRVKIDQKKLFMLKIRNLGKIVEKTKNRAFYKFLANIYGENIKGLIKKIHTKTQFGQKSVGISLKNLLRNLCLNRILADIFNTITESLSLNYNGPVLQTSKQKKKLLILNLQNLAKVTNNTKQKALYKLYINLYKKTTKKLNHKIKTLKNELSKKSTLSQKAASISLINAIQNSALARTLCQAFITLTGHLIENYNGNFLSTFKDKNKIINLKLLNLIKKTDRNKQKAFYAFITNIFKKSIRKLKKIIKKRTLLSKKASAISLINTIKNSGFNRYFGYIFADITEKSNEKYSGILLNNIKDQKKNNGFRLLNLAKIVQKNKQKAFNKMRIKLEKGSTKKMRKSKSKIKKKLKKMKNLCQKALGLSLVNAVKSSGFIRTLGSVLFFITDGLGKNYARAVISIALRNFEKMFCRHFMIWKDQTKEQEKKKLISRIQKHKKLNQILKFIKFLANLPNRNLKGSINRIILAKSRVLECITNVYFTVKRMPKNSFDIWRFKSNKIKETTLNNKLRSEKLSNYMKNLTRRTLRGIFYLESLKNISLIFAVSASVKLTMKNMSDRIKTNLRNSWQLWGKYCKVYYQEIGIFKFKREKLKYCLSRLLKSKLNIVFRGMISDKRQECLWEVCIIFKNHLSRVLSQWNNHTQTLRIMSLCFKINELGYNDVETHEDRKKKKKVLRRFVRRCLKNQKRVFRKLKSAKNLYLKQKIVFFNMSRFLDKMIRKALKETFGLIISWDKGLEE
ncbi:hypothetical protein SteCoe_4786 [Stentor coeruleus]|uniref:Uncharacterized protein n=1 Tax=Stentor coeruleus TaxID=5963 RepID=A0A1R2CTW6_9CILI|nr:hypothetical protein SteCoe_4786 [Stentor coeruleus]